MYCQKCGSLNNDDSVFCYTCGTKLEKTDQIAASPIQQESSGQYAVAKNYKPIIIAAVSAISVLFIACTIIFIAIISNHSLDGTYYSTNVWDDSGRVTFEGNRIAIWGRGRFEDTYSINGDKIKIYSTDGGLNSEYSFSRKNDYIYINGQEFHKR